MSQATADSGPGGTAASAPQGRELLVSAAPHLAAGRSTRWIMFQVVGALVPLLVMGTVFYGSRAIFLTAFTVGACLATEAIANAIRGRGQASLGDGSAIVTGMILAFSLPPGLNFYMAVIGGAVAIALAKAIFGGLGQNLFNPAMVGRAFLMICFPAAMGVWSEPATVFESLSEVQANGVSMDTAEGGGVDGMTMATPLQADASYLPTLRALFVGQVGGSLGETSALAALLGGLYLVFRGVADWRLVASTLAGAVIVAFIAHWAAPQSYEGPVFHLLAGALMFGAFFIATDYVGAPITPAGRWIFGLGVGVLVMIIRLFGAYPEGFMFAILVMNALTPVIERVTIPTPFGGHVVTS